MKDARFPCESEPFTNNASQNWESLSALISYDSLITVTRRVFLILSNHPCGSADSEATAKIHYLLSTVDSVCSYSPPFFVSQFSSSRNSIRNYQKYFFSFHCFEILVLQLKWKILGVTVCHENLGSREGFHRVCSIDDSSSEYASLIGCHVRLI